jgi:ankyrin repeat protein
MPRELEGTFLEMIRRIESQPEGKKNQGLSTLQWVLLSERQLTIEELRHALSIRPGDKQLDEEGFPTNRALLDCCFGLVIIDESTESVRLVHKSLQDFFKKNSGKLFPRGHEEIASTCLTYMGFNKNSHLDSTKRVLHDYAIRNWGHHVRKSSDGAVAAGIGSFEIASAILRDNSSNSYGYFPWFDTYNRQYHRYELGYIDSTTESDIFHIPVHFGLTGLVQYILENWTIDIEHGFKYGVYTNQTPLLRAVKLGHNALVRLLLEKGADTEPYDSDGYRPLLFAAERGNEAAVRLLLDADADIEAQKGGRSQGTTALIAAAGSGHYTIVKLLLDKGANVDSEAYDGSTPLMNAVFHPLVVHLLLERGADVNLRDGEGYTALQLGVSKIATLKLLLENGANIEDKQDTGTALSKAAYRGLDASVQFLLDKGADIEAPDIRGRPPLYYAALRGNESTIRLLLHNGANPHSKDKDGRTIWIDMNRTLRDKVTEDENHFLRKFLT